MNHAQFSHVALYMKTLSGAFAEPLRNLLGLFSERGISVKVEDRAKPLLETVLPADVTSRIVFFVPESLPEETDLAVVLGGDGTMLRVVRSLGARALPVVGINFGSLGFLTEVAREEMIPSLEQILEGNFRLEKRLRVDVRLLREGGTACEFLALNEAVLTKGALARIIRVDITVGPHFLSSYNADGFIVSTPTGSTAYALSAGGPIVTPQGRSLVLAPICPHTLTHRPIVLDAAEPVRVRLVAGEDVTVTVDGQVGAPVLPGDTVEISVSPHDARVLIPNSVNFFDVLRRKLSWGRG